MGDGETSAFTVTQFCKVKISVAVVHYERAPSGNYRSRQLLESKVQIQPK